MSRIYDLLERPWLYRIITNLLAPGWTAPFPSGSTLSSGSFRPPRISWTLAAAHLPGYGESASTQLGWIFPPSIHWRSTMLESPLPLPRLMHCPSRVNVLEACGASGCCIIYPKIWPNKLLRK